MLHTSHEPFFFSLSVVVGKALTVSRLSEGGGNASGVSPLLRAGALGIGMARLPVKASISLDR